MAASPTLLPRAAPLPPGAAGAPPPPVEGHTLTAVAGAAAASGDDSDDEEEGETRRREREPLLLLFGGRGEDGGIRGDVWGYSGNWRRIRPADGRPPPCRFGHAAAGLQSSLFVLGGHSDGSGSAPPSADLLCLRDYDGAWSWTLIGSDPGGGCAGHSLSAGPGGSLWAYGGESEGSSLRSDLRVFDPSSGSWQVHGAGRCAPAGGPQARAGHGAAMCDSIRLSLLGPSSTPDETALVIFGGTLDGPTLTCTDEVWAFGAESQRWLKLFCGGDTPAPRTGHTLCSLPSQGSLIACGGVGSDGSLLGGVYSLHLVSLSWRQVSVHTGGPPRVTLYCQEFATARCRHAAAAVEGHDGSIAVVVCGGRGGCGRLDDGDQEDSLSPYGILTDVTVVAAAPPPGSPRRTPAPPPRRRRQRMRPQPPRPRAPATPPPGPRPFSAMSHLGRLFGAAPRTPRAAAVMDRLRDARMTPDAERTALQRLAARRPKPAEPTPREWPKLSVDEQVEMVHRLHDSVRDTATEKRALLLSKWRPRWQGLRLTKLEFENAVSRLTKTPDPLPAPPRRPRLRYPDRYGRWRSAWEERLVHRLVTRAVKSRRGCLRAAFRQHTPYRPDKVMSRQSIEEMIGRLCQPKGERQVNESSWPEARSPGAPTPTGRRPSTPALADLSVPPIPAIQASSAPMHGRIWMQKALPGRQAASQRSSHSSVTFPTWTQQQTLGGAALFH
eukprot:TRINITY_DN3101_c1_g3_i2.p1 TRINITY_DN3101_c1_g3~~TRINITY_DN3101_c1_g3_i2.p1  ORF type:complete len:738 (+),score=119.48 TRINITY_DN3101_c1_g3_i2:51-2216(+)